MKQYLRHLYRNFQLQGFIFTVRLSYNLMYYLLTLFGFYIRKNERRFRSYKNKHKDQRCFIIGNGPSLNKLDLTNLKNEFTFGVNAIYTNFDRMQFYPTYYVVEDTFVAEDRKEEINSYTESQKFFGDYLSYCLNKDEKSIKCNVVFDYSYYKDFPKFSKNALTSMYVGGTVTYLCLQLAYYMGFTEVYLIGFDHNYVIPDTAEVEGKDILSTTDDVNHFSKDYFGKGKRWHDPMVDRMEISYRKAKLIYEENGRKVFNATHGGKLEVFERMEYSSLFS